LGNSFNPSFIKKDDVIYLSFRAKSNNAHSKFDAFLLTYDLKSRQSQLKNLSESTLCYNINPTADPKLTLIDNDVWLTFNTGYKINGNEVYLWQVNNRKAKPVACHYENRQRIEKNWGFFQHNQSLYCIYSLADSMFLKSTNFNSDTFSFAASGIKPAKLSTLHGYTIGSQPFRHSDGYYYLIAHKKFTVLKKRLYLGRLIRFRFEGGNSHFQMARDFLSHSYKSLLGSKTKHNKNLISCTYFSGLNVIDNQLIASYGINDIDFNFANLASIDEISWRDC
jgi:hypothetical protein